jgi:predicted RND superfamily exporter protein
MPNYRRKHSQTNEERLLQDIFDPEEIINIDLDGLGGAAEEEAKCLVQTISELYGNEILQTQPRLKKRIESDLESLRINLKMRKADEQAHDILIKNIAVNPNNASLYRALTDMQKTILDITSKIEKTIEGLSSVIKRYQLELNFDNSEQQTQQINETNIHRGSKSFIESMNEYLDSEHQIQPESKDVDNSVLV